MKVVSGDPIETEFHRAWLGNRRVTGRLMFDGAPYQPSNELLARAWTSERSYPPITLAPEVRPDGTFEIAFDSDHISLLFVDSPKQRGGFARLGPGDSTVDLIMKPTAAYSGTLLDRIGQPMPDRRLSLDVNGTAHEALPPQRTDKKGRFQFTGIVAHLPLALRIRNEDEWYVSSGKRSFEPGDARTNDVVYCERSNSPVAPRPPRPLAESIAETCRDASLGHMRALVLLQGDAAPKVTYVTNQLLDDDQVTTIVNYLPLQVVAARLKTEAAALGRFAWPQPGRDEIVLVVLDDDQKSIAAERIKTDDMAAAVARGSDFLIRHAPPKHDALASLTAARKEAQASNRRVWIVYGGPRCGPCFRLARWLDDHRATLEKDYVVVKVMGGLDEHVAETIDALPRMEQSIPWYAITEPYGTVLVTSEGPLGNIGIPGTADGFRHFRQMLERTVQRLTSEDIERLIKSLSMEK